MLNKFYFNIVNLELSFAIDHDCSSSCVFFFFFLFGVLVSNKHSCLPCRSFRPSLVAVTVTTYQYFRYNSQDDSESMALKTIIHCLSVLMMQP
jgi:hypothetical protein